MREIADCLHDLFEFDRPQFVEQNRENYRYRETDQQGPAVDDERIPNQLGQRRRAEKINKIFIPVRLGVWGTKLM